MEENLETKEKVSKAKVYNYIYFANKRQVKRAK
jgi:hypothetical protein